jgi:hypothetical protein
MNLEEVRKLVDRLEQDLARVRGESADVEAIKAELEALKKALASPEAPHHGSVREALESLSDRIDAAAETVKTDAVLAAPYVTWIGRILGLS